jgi:hypothetical protein
MKSPAAPENPLARVNWYRISAYLAFAGLAAWTVGFVIGLIVLAFGA